jgi:large subunit ribosomal protein L5
MNRKKQLYHEKVVPFLQEKYGKKNAFSVAKLQKITVNVGIGNELTNREQVVKNVSEQMSKITGQKPSVAAARKSIASFKIRQGEPIGVVVTLRGERMWDFLDRLVSLVLPQVKDFSGVSRTAFDQSGSYSLGLSEQIVFPEINYDDIDKVRGLQMVFTVKNSSGVAESFDLLQQLGMPFKKEDK